MRRFFQHYITWLLLCGLAPGLLLSGCKNLPKDSGATPVKQADDTKMQWWRDAKFGMFIHWGVYAVPAGIWEPSGVTGGGEWIMFGAKIPTNDYRSLAQEFNPVHYDPDAWAQLAKDAGMKYMVITAKHHDGFALYDSKVTDWDIADATPYGKGLLRPLVQAAKSQDLKIGFYYSQAQDWMHAGGAKFRMKEGEGWDEQHQGDFDDYLRTIAEPQMREILSNYEIDILWWDTPVWMNEERGQLFQPLLDAHPNLIQNDRLTHESHGDVETPENFIPARGLPGRNWETCMTMNGSWGYDTSATDWKTTEYLLHALADVVSMDGNLLLNIGPKPDGTIPKESIEALQEIGAWMQVNEEAIHATSGSPVGRPGWGRITTKQLGNVTRLYLHVFYWPEDGQLIVPVHNRANGCWLLADPERSFKTSNSEKGLIVSLDGEAPNPINSVLVLDISGSPKPGDLRLTQAFDGSLHAQAMDAFIINGNFGKQTYYQHDESGGHIEQWKSPRVRLEWDIRIDKPGVYNVELEAATPAEGSQITFSIDGQLLTAVVHTTISNETYQRSTIGKVTISEAGEHRLEAMPVRDGWSPVNLRAVRLIPSSN